MTPNNRDASRFKLVANSDAWDAALENYAFTTFAYSDGEDYFVYHPERWADACDPVNHQQFVERAAIVPKSYYCPEVTEGLTKASDPLSPDVYIKKVIPLDFDKDAKDDTSSADMVLREAKICERLLANPHPNVCRYFGYHLDRDGFITGLCFQRLEKTLKDVNILGVDYIVDGIMKGLAHIHSLGFVHNDVNPSNIMFDAAGTAVIIDFDSCQSIGVKLEGKSGTPFWSNETDASEVENDFFGLKKVEEHIRSLGQKAEEERSE